MPRAIRSFRLGNRYTIDAIRDRLLGKREEMIRSEVGDHILTLGSPAQIYVKTTPLKKYADMNAEEKQEAIRMLKLGRNPWREQYKSNWQLQRIAEEFHRTANIYELIRTYAPDTGSISRLSTCIGKQKSMRKGHICMNLPDVMNTCQIIWNTRCLWTGWKKDTPKP